MGFLKTLGWTAINLGVDPRRFRDGRHLSRFLRDRKNWIKAGGRVDVNFPILSDFDESAGSANGHYFHMDLLVARLVAEVNPKRHLDIGSRIDGFIAHVAAFRQIDVMDIRSVAIPAHPQINFVQGDMMDPDFEKIGTTDSLSCLHVLEHVGLGRYGDPIDPDGHRRAFVNMIKLLQPGGTFYFASPVGKSKIMFNAHRVFDPIEIPTWEPSKLRLKRFDHVDDDGALHLESSPDAAACFDYGCGIYTFERLD